MYFSYCGQYEPVKGGGLNAVGTGAGEGIDAAHALHSG